MSTAFRIKDVRVYSLKPAAKGGTYFEPGESTHWLVDSQISNPMSGYEKYRAKRSSWGIGVLGSLVVEIETADGTTGVAMGSGGEPAGWMIRHHFARFIVGQDARNVNLIWDQLYRSSLPYGRKGMTIMAISAVDLALWDLVGKVRGEPVYNLIGGLSRDEITFYCTGPDAAAIKRMGFWGAKVPLPHGPFEGEAGLRKNVAFLKAQRDKIGPDFPLMVDCYMSLTVDYAIRLADILQPDVMWVGGMSELLKIAAHAGAYDIPVVPHGSGPYSYQFIAAQTGPAFCEYVAASPDGQTIQPVFGEIFADEPVPVEGKLRLSDAPGFGMTLADRSVLAPVD